MTTIIREKKIVAFFALLTGIATVLLITPIHDPDLWWHITVGRWIIAHSDVPHMDLWGQWSYEQPWIAYSWLAEILFAFLDQINGILGLVGLKILLALLWALSVSLALRAASSGNALSQPLALMVLVASASNFSLRPQVFAWIACIWMLVGCERLKSKEMKDLLGSYLIIISCVLLWANTHLTAPIAVGVIFFWNPPFLVKRRKLKSPQFCALIFSALATCATPYLGESWLLLGKKLLHPFSFDQIVEFQAASIQSPSTWCVVLLAAASLFYGAKSAQKQWGRFVLVLSTLVAALLINKLLPFSAIFSGVWLACNSKQMSKDGALSALHFTSNRAVRLFAALGLVGVLAFQVFVLSRSPLNEQIIPKTAVDYIQKEELPFPLLNDFGRGGYIIYRYSHPNGDPGYLVPIDGRTNLIPEDVWRKFLKTLRGEPGWEEYLELIEPNTILWRTPSHLEDYLLERGGWCVAKRFPEKESGIVVLLRQGILEPERENRVCSER